MKQSKIDAIKEFLNSDTVPEGISNSGLAKILKANSRTFLLNSLGTMQNYIGQVKRMLAEEEAAAEALVLASKDLSREDIFELVFADLPNATNSALAKEISNRGYLQDLTVGSIGVYVGKWKNSKRIEEEIAEDECAVEKVCGTRSVVPTPEVEQMEMDFTPEPLAEPTPVPVDTRRQITLLHASMTDHSVLSGDVYTYGQGLKKGHPSLATEMVNRWAYLDAIESIIMDLVITKAEIPSSIVFNIYVDRFDYGSMQNEEEIAELIGRCSRRFGWEFRLHVSDMTMEDAGELRMSLGIDSANFVVS